MTQTILPTEWVTFLERFTREHEGRPAWVQVLGGHGWGNAAPHAVLRNVALRPLAHDDPGRDDHASELVLTGDADGVPVVLAVPHPVYLRRDGSAAHHTDLIIERFNGPPTRIRVAA